MSVTSPSDDDEADATVDEEEKNTGALRHAERIAERTAADYEYFRADLKGIAEPGHWMLATGIRGRKPKRELLLVDPWSGRAAWCGERDFIKGTFAARDFDLAGDGERPYVEEVFVP